MSFKERFNDSKTMHPDVLDLSGLQLTKIPKEVFEMEDLLYLDLSDNKITNIPKEILKLEFLKGISISNNLIERLPEEVCHLEDLKTIVVEGNPLKFPPYEVAIYGIGAIINFFEELNVSKEEDYLYEIKLILVGHGKVGKTSLARSIVNPNYQLENVLSTHGIEIYRWDIKKEELNLKKDFRINIWDFGGQEIYHSTHQFFLTRRSLYLLVTEARDEDDPDDFQYWLNSIKLLGEASPTMIVLNKCDERIKDFPMKELTGAFPNIQGFKEVSCDSKPIHKRSIESLKYDIKDIIVDKRILPHIGSPLPKVWVDVRRELGKLKDTGIYYISLNEYLEICKDFGMSKRRALWASQFFHDVGVFLHFQENPILRNTIFLVHEFVTNAVYGVINDEQIKRKGTFTITDARNIWKTKNYREKVHEFIELMRNRHFEICFEIGKDKYIVPQLLPEDRIEFQWNEEDNLRFAYEYMFMPKGLLNRFIVRRHDLIDDHLYWKRGVVLIFEGSRALIEEKYLTKKITIEIQGNNRKGLLSIIRSTFNAIHEEYKNLVFDENIPCTCSYCSKSTDGNFFRYKLLKQYKEEGEEQIYCELGGLKKVSVREMLGIFDDSSVQGRKSTISILPKPLSQLKQEEFLDEIQNTLKNIESSVLKLRGVLKDEPTKFDKIEPKRFEEILWTLEILSESKDVIQSRYSLLDRLKSFIELLKNLQSKLPESLVEVLSEMETNYNTLIRLIESD